MNTELNDEHTTDTASEHPALPEELTIWNEKTHNFIPIGGIELYDPTKIQLIQKGTGRSRTGNNRQLVGLLHWSGAQHAKWRGYSSSLFESVPLHEDMLESSAQYWLEMSLNSKDSGYDTEAPLFRVLFDASYTDAYFHAVIASKMNEQVLNDLLDRWQKDGLLAVREAWAESRMEWLKSQAAVKFASELGLSVEDALALLDKASETKDHAQKTKIEEETPKTITLDESAEIEEKKTIITDEQNNGATAKAKKRAAVKN